MIFDFLEFQKKAVCHPWIYMNRFYPLFQISEAVDKLSKLISSQQLDKSSKDQLSNQGVDTTLQLPEGFKFPGGKVIKLTPTAHSLVFPHAVGYARVHVGFRKPPQDAEDRGYYLHVALLQLGSALSSSALVAGVEVSRGGWKNQPVLTVRLANAKLKDHLKLVYGEVLLIFVQCILFWQYFCKNSD